MVRIVTTEDGSHSLYNDQLRESYHSLHGAVQESQHVFIKEGLDYFYSTSNQAGGIHVFEVGFGTGLNAVLSALWATVHHIPTIFFSIESHPLDDELIKKLNYGEFISDKEGLFNTIHRCDWDQPVQINEWFKIEKRCQKIEAADLPSDTFDVLYYDAFAPSRQPEMWTLNLIKKCLDTLKSGGVLVTYCARGQLKRDLRNLGCEVQTLPGPPGKKEMVRAIKS